MSIIPDAFSLARSSGMRESIVDTIDSTDAELLVLTWFVIASNAPITAEIVLSVTSA